MVESYMEQNVKVRKNKKNVDPETKKQALEAKDKYLKFRQLVDSDPWKECQKFLEEEVYKSLNFAPGDGGDWWARYAWGIKACLERIKSHAEKYDEAIKFLENN